MQVADARGGDVHQVVVRSGQVVQRAGLGLRQRMLDEGCDQRPAVRLDPSYDSRAEAARLDAFATGELPDGAPIYGRLGNPTVRRFESALGATGGVRRGGGLQRR